MLQHISNILKALGQALKKEEGATAVEYGMLVALIAAVIVATVVTLGTEIKAAFDTIVANL
ncbi:MAG: Flp family type IVb pilin [Actinomycetota bacterium]